MPTLTVIEEILGSHKDQQQPQTALDVATSTMSGEDILRSYVYQLHSDAAYAARKDKLNREATLSDDEKRLNSKLQKRDRSKDCSQSSFARWKESAEAAIEAFSEGRLFVFVDDKQVMPAYPAVEVPAKSTVRFVQVIPLVGG
jgi:hypothetical protein